MCSLRRYVPDLSILCTRPMNLSLLMISSVAAIYAEAIYELITRSRSLRFYTDPFGGKQMSKSKIMFIMADPQNASYTEQGIEPLTAPKTARDNITKQAPGLKTKKQDLLAIRCGTRLREWLGAWMKIRFIIQVTAVMPMDFYFPDMGER